MIGSMQEYKLNLFDALLHGTSLGDLLEIGTKYLGYPIIALDNSTTLLAITKRNVLERFSDDDSLYDLVTNGYCAYEYLVKYKIPETIELTLQRGTFILDTHFAVNMRRILAPIMVDNVMDGYLATFEIDRPFSEDDVTAMDLLAKACGMVIKNSGTYMSSKYSLSKSVLKSYLTGRISDSDAFLELYKSFMGKDYAYYHVLCVRSVGNDDDDQVGLISLLDPLEKLLPTGLVFYVDSNIVVLIGADQKNNPETEAVIERFLEANNLQGGLSEWFSDIAKARKNYLQASGLAAVDPAQCKMKHLITYNRHYLQYCFSQMESAIDLRQLISPEIHALIKYDEKNGMDFFKTLCGYMDHNMNIVDTAEAMFIHRNTLRYRIKKISAIMEMDIEDYRNFDTIRLSLAAARWINTSRKH